MTQVTKPMLAGKVKFDKIDVLAYPLLASPKYDGVRMLIYGNGEPKTRTGKRIANKSIHHLLANSGLKNVDGELMSPNLSFTDLSGLIRTIDQAKFNIGYFIFDWMGDPDMAFFGRADYLKKNIKPQRLSKNKANIWIYIVPHTEVRSPDELLLFFEQQVEEGQEGIMLRSPFGAYKQGRSTLAQQYLLKLKPALSETATITGYQKLINKIGDEVEELGALLVRNEKWGSFKIGTGFNRDQRINFWKSRRAIIGRKVKFTYAHVGNKNSPRFPSFKGIID